MKNADPSGIGSVLLESSNNSGGAGSFLGRGSGFVPASVLWSLSNEPAVASASDSEMGPSSSFLKL